MWEVEVLGTRLFQRPSVPDDGQQEQHDSPLPVCGPSGDSEIEEEDVISSRSGRASAITIGGPTPLRGRLLTFFVFMFGNEPSFETARGRVYLWR
jgi:hypothetical protein